MNIGWMALCLLAAWSFDGRTPPGLSPCSARR